MGREGFQEEVAWSYDFSRKTEGEEPPSEGSSVCCTRGSDPSGTRGALAMRCKLQEGRV